jgi:hypothetical protein
MMIPRRSVIIGLVGLITSPAVVRAVSTMPVKRIERPKGYEEPEGNDRTSFTICDWDLKCHGDEQLRASDDARSTARARL